MDNWQNDKLQFARLISEIESAGGFTEKLCETLCNEMDIDMNELDELVTRAQQCYENFNATI